MKNELISIIVPIYNTSNYLDKCIESIINQTYKNIEIILVNDGSTDNSLDICNKYKLLDNRIIIINKKNGGLSSSKNAGLDIHKGQYISFIDSDDYIDNNFIEELYNNIIYTNSDISLCNYYTTINNIDYPNYSNNFILEENNKYNYLFSIYAFQTVSSCNKLYKDYIFDNLRFSEGIYHEDTHLICDILFKANRISYMLDKCMYHYCRRNNSISTSYNIRSFDNVEAYKKIYKFLINNNIDFNYSKINMTIYVNIKRILININDKDNIDIINKYKYECRKYQKEILNDRNQNLYSKIKVILLILIPKIYFKIKNYRDRRIFK